MSSIIFLTFLLGAAVSFAGDYVIGEGDVLGVAVWGVNELSFDAKVRPDGKITVPGLGEVLAAGKSPKQLQQTLEKDLKKLVKNPIVTVTVREITNNQVHVFGGGVPAGVFDLSRRTSLLQLLCNISDFTNADLKRAYVLRDQKKIKEGFEEIFLEGEASQDIILESGDVVFIPVADEKNVYVVGAVNTPKFIAYREGLTVMEAVLEAGGFNKFAKPNDTVIVREVNGNETRIPVKMNDLIKSGDLTQNVKLQTGDYVIIREGLF